MHAVPTRSRSPLLALALLLPACEQLPPVSYETEHLLIGTAFESPLCRGDLDHLELVVTTAEAQLQTTVTHPIEVYVWDPIQSPTDPGWCSGDAAGCFFNGKVYSSPSSLDHELIHAVLATLPNRPAPFWSEGAAEALQSSRTFLGPSSPIDNLELDNPELSYKTAGHFSRWLLETRGSDLYRALLASPHGANKAFETTYDMSIEAAQAEYLETAPYSYPALISCDHPVLDQSDGAAWTELVDVNCEATGVRAGPASMLAFRVLTIATRGHYTLWTSAELGFIGRCPDFALDSMPLPADPSFGDLPPVTEAFPEQFVLPFAVDGQATTLELVPGRYRVAVGFNDFDAHTAQLEIATTDPPP